MVYYAAKKGFWIYIGTNGRLLRPEVADRLGDGGVGVLNFALDAWDEKPSLPKAVAPSRKHLEYLMKKQYVYGYMVFFNINICRNNTQDVRQITEYARDNCVATDYHINETPMLEQDEHFTHLSDNPTYIRPEDWPEIDSLADWLIGRNEYSAIRICQELAAAQKEYYAVQHNEYAKQIYSDEGQHNGLYWKVSEGEPQSPIGPLVASAVAEGYVRGKDAPPTPYRGYFFHMLTRQGKAAPGGAKTYVVNGKMTEGFAFVAYPAEYRSSGVMTFIVNQDGVVYQKDLGKKTEALGKSMHEYNPDSSWSKEEEEPSQTASGQKP